MTEDVAFFTKANYDDNINNYIYIYILLMENRSVFDMYIKYICRAIVDVTIKSMVILHSNE